MAKQQIWQAVCDRCYTCVRYEGPSKRAAEREATSHLALCPGHNISILTVNPFGVRVPVDQTERTRTPAQERAHERRMAKWAKEYDQLNGGPESDDDR